MASVRKCERRDATEPRHRRRDRTQVGRRTVDDECHKEIPSEVAHARECEVADETQTVQLLGKGQRKTHNPYNPDPHLPSGQHFVPSGVIVVARVFNDGRESVADNDEIADHQADSKDENEEVIGISCPRGNLLGGPLEVDVDLCFALRLVLLELLFDEAVRDLREQEDRVPAEEGKEHSQDDAQDDAELHEGQGEREDTSADGGVDETEDRR